MEKPKTIKYQVYAVDIGPLSIRSVSQIFYSDNTRKSQQFDSPLDFSPLSEDLERISPEDRKGVIFDTDKIPYIFGDRANPNTLISCKSLEAIKRYWGAIIAKDMEYHGINFTKSVDFRLSLGLRQGKEEFEEIVSALEDIKLQRLTPSNEVELHLGTYTKGQGVLWDYFHSKEPDADLGRSGYTIVLDIRYDTLTIMGFENGKVIASDCWEYHHLGTEPLIEAVRRELQEIAEYEISEREAIEAMGNGFIIIRDEKLEILGITSEFFRDYVNLVVDTLEDDQRKKLSGADRIILAGEGTDYLSAGVLKSYGDEALFRTLVEVKAPASMSTARGLMVIDETRGV